MVDITIDGASISGLTIDGTDVAEVTIDGTLAWEAVSPWDLSAATLSQTIISKDTDTRSIEWNNDGTKFYQLSDTADVIYEFDASTPFDISTLSYSQSMNLHGDYGRSMTWNDDGTKLYELSGDSDVGGEKLTEYNLSTAFDISTATEHAQIDEPTDFVRGIQWNNDGSKFFHSDWGGTAEVLEYDASTPYDITTLTLSETKQYTDMSNAEWGDDGAKLYIINLANDTINEYNVSTPYDLTTASSTSQYTMNLEDLGYQSMTWNDDGSKMYLLENTNDEIREYEL